MTEQQQALWDRYLAVDRRSLGEPGTVDPRAKAVEDELFATYWKLIQWLAREFVGPDRGPKRKHMTTEFADAVGQASETWLAAMRTWQPGAAKFTTYACLCVRRQLWKSEKRLSRRECLSLADPVARLEQLGKTLAVEIMASAPGTTEADLRSLRKALGIREPRPKRPRPKACANTDAGEAIAEESTVLAS